MSKERRTGHRIGFVSTRLAGTDGVSLETSKWSSVLAELGHECYYFAGESDRPADRSLVVGEAHFQHPDILALTGDLFDDYRRAPKTTERVEALKGHLKSRLYQFVRQFDIELLILENALAIPMNVPLGLALTELIAETHLPSIGHHHDFYWERSRYLVNAASDYLRAAFPPDLPTLRHVVINSEAGRQLSLRTGVSPLLIPNVMDFANPPPPPDDYASDLRQALGAPASVRLVLQPTRVVPRKRIERAIELLRRLECECRLVITHASGDEGTEYAAYLRDYADLLGVELLFAAGIFEYERRRTEDDRKIYSLRDAYEAADLITYPSTIEGFGNAFLEAIYYRRPLVMSRYAIFQVDIQPKGFQVVAFDQVIDADTIAETRALLEDPAGAAAITAHNYELGRKYYSYQVLETRLLGLLHDCFGA